MKIGSLFSGVAGLDRAVEAVTGATPAWFVEFDAAPSQVLARHYPDVPNYGDVTTVDWSTVEPVDIITGGFPCQDLSHAGNRKGLRPGTRSGLWEHMAYAIDQIQPRMVVIENVRGLLSAEAHSNVEPCAWCLGDDSDSYMRALGAVLADLADIGYDAKWRGLRAADAGAPHGRFRVFIVAYPRVETVGLGTGLRAREPSGIRRLRPDDGDPQDATLLPTPVVNDMGIRKTPEQWDEWTDDMQDRHGNGNGNGKSLAIEAQRLLPTPRATDGTKGGPNQRGSSGDLMLPSAVQRDNLLPTPTAQAAKHGSTPDVTANGYGSNLWDVSTLLPTPTRRDHKGRNQRDDDTCLPGAVADYGQYAPAIARWENILGETAPSPTIQGKNGPRLNPDLPRWMMGFPPGWLDGLTPAQQLKAAGNAVCQQQAELALRILLGDS